jgi:hypothetical protein
MFKTIDETRLEVDLHYRISYLCGFLNFEEDDIAAIHAAANWLSPLVPGLVDAVYEKLFSYDATLRHFMPAQAGYEGVIPQNFHEIRHDHPLIMFRKQHLARYLASLVTRPFNDKFCEYLDMVGKIHTPHAGNPMIQVPLVQMNALLGFVADALSGAIFAAGLDSASEEKTIRAFQKLLWIQNDLISRHYLSARACELAA